MSTPELWTEGAKTLLNRVIREKGFTQLKVQAALGWGRSFISQAVTGGKELRFDVVLQVLFVIGMDPEEFFARLARGLSPVQAVQPGEGAAGEETEVAELRRSLHALARLLVEHQTLPANDVEAILSRKRPSSRARGSNLGAG